MTINKTDRLGLRVPDIGTLNWGDEVNDNTEITSSILSNIQMGNGVKSGLAVTDGGTLQLNYTSGVATVNGTDHTVTSGNKTATALTGPATVQRNFLYVNSSGVVQISTTAPSGNYALLVIADCDATEIVAVYDVASLPVVSAESPTFTGQATIPAIDLTGGQIKFPATAIPSSDPNTLDDYEEGTWTPVATLDVPGDSSNTDQTGIYQIIGNTFYYQSEVTFDKGTGTGELIITGLPKSQATFSRGIVSVYGNGVYRANHQLCADVLAQTFRLRLQPDTGTFNIAAVDTDLHSTIYIRLMGNFPV